MLLQYCDAYDDDVLIYPIKIMILNSLPTKLQGYSCKWINGFIVPTGGKGMRSSSQPNAFFVPSPTYFVVRGLFGAFSVDLVGSAVVSLLASSAAAVAFVGASCA